MRPGLKAQARAWQDRLRALKNLPPVLALLWNSGRALVATEVSLRVLSALIPVTALWVSKLIIDAIVAAGAGHPVSVSRVWWLLGAYIVLEIGELCLSPIGLAAVTQLSVVSVVGLMMGAYWLATSLAEQAAALFSSFAALDIGEGEKIDFAVAKLKYGALFDHMLWLGLAAALVAFLLSPIIKRWMHGVK